MNYRSICNAFALQKLYKLPEMPDFTLGIGSAENLSPVPVMIQKQHVVPSVVVENMKKYSQLSNEDISRMIEENVIEVNDLNDNTGLLGSPLGGGLYANHGTF